MSHSQISPADPRRSLILNIMDVSHHVEIVLQRILNPPPGGLYLPAQLNPVMEAGRQYWFEVPQVTHANPTFSHLYRYNYQPVVDFSTVAQFPWDVVNQDTGVGAVVLPHYLSKLASQRPTMPYFGIKIVLEMIDNDIRSSRAFSPERQKRLEEILLPYVQPHLNRIDLWEQMPDMQHTINAAFDVLLGVLRPVRDFLRGNPYQMCELHSEHLDCVRVDQLGDYRISDWERRRASGEWN